MRFSCVRFDFKEREQRMKLSVQSQNLVAEYGMEKAYRMIREAGFEAIDWNIDHAWSFKNVCASQTFDDLCIFEKSLPEIMEHYAAELAEIRRNGLVIGQAHAPFGCYSHTNPGVLEYAIRIYQNVIRFCEAVGCPYVVVHGITKTEEMDDLTSADVEKLNMHLYESLIPVLQETNGVTVCLENLFCGARKLGGVDYWEGCCSNPYQAAEWVDRLNAKAGKKCFGFCLDTGHLNLLRKPFHSFVPIVADRICILHVQDNSQSGDSHLMPYAGTIHWDEFLKEMKAVGYQGNINFETFAQVKKARLPEALVPTFLRTIAEIGAYFREELQA